MGLKLLLFIVLPLTFLAQQSTIQEQSTHYKNFSFSKENQWDSLNTIENGTIYQANSNQQKTTNCTLNKKVYGWHPYWVGSVYTKVILIIIYF